MAQQAESRDKRVAITLTFAVRDEAELRRQAREAVEEHGNGVELDGSLGQAIAELLLHSNPGVQGYIDYGLELVGETYRDGHQ